MEIDKPDDAIHITKQQNKVAEDDDGNKIKFAEDTNHGTNIILETNEVTKDEKINTVEIKIVKEEGKIEAKEINVAGVKNDPVFCNTPETPKRKRNENKKGATSGIKRHKTTYAMQCWECEKWRKIESREEFEERRDMAENKGEQFICSSVGRSCIEEEDMNPSADDGSNKKRKEDFDGEDEHKVREVKWFVDKKGMPRIPKGWERLVRPRKQSCKRQFDVYYLSPCGKLVRSKTEVSKLLEKNPDYVSMGVTPAQFSFNIPALLSQFLNPFSFSPSTNPN